MAFKIKLYDYLGIDTLRHRDSAKTVLDRVVKTPLHDKITIDFSGISFARARDSRRSHPQASASGYLT
jgi:hypothetical protein